jgi:hypothetical protein
VDLESGSTELSSAINVNVNETGEISRRNGLTATDRTEAVHSMFCDGGDCFFVSGAYLYRLNTDYSRLAVRSGLTVGLRMSYCQVLEKTYYMNTAELGVIIDGVSYVWYAGAYVGPTTTRRFSNPPVGQLLTHFNGRIYIAKNDTIWYSEPFAYNWFDMARNFIQMGEYIKMLRAVSGGIYVGLNRRVFFLAGTEPSDFIIKTVSDSPMVLGTDIYVFGTDIGDGSIGERVVMWTASNGVYVGQSDGTVVNVTRNRLSLPLASMGCSVYNNNRYITILQ